MLKSLLQSFHLNAKETKIFRALMEEGVQPASVMARLCKMPRNTVRTILDGLVQRGLVAKTLKANTQYYRVAKTEDVIRFLKAQHTQVCDRIEQQIELLEQMGDQFKVTSGKMVLVHDGREAADYKKSIEVQASPIYCSDAVEIYVLDDVAVFYLPQEKRVVQIPSANLAAALPAMVQKSKKMPVVAAAEIPPAPEQQSLL